MRKKFLVFVSMLFFVPSIVNASSANVKISAPDSVYVGDSVTVNVTVSSGVSLGSWQYNISYDDSKLSYVSTTASAAQGAADTARSGGQTSVTYSWTFKATAAGSASFSVSAIDVWAWDSDADGNDIKLSANTPSVSINVVKPSAPSNNGGGSSGGSGGGSSTPTTQYKYSDDNNLSSLNIEGFSLDFDSSVSEYSVTVPNDTKKVKIGATANDGKASVSGIGEYDVKEGSNEIEIVVTAENGDKKTYKVTVVVKELAPIEVNVNDKSYNVVRKKDKLPSVNSTYKESSILIKGESVPCYHSDITDIYLIGLMDDKGDIVLYRYDASSDKFSDYNEINVSGLYISLIDSKDIPDGYSNGLVKIGDKDYKGYIREGSYSLIYGINLESGESNFYSFDSSEGTLQKFLVVKVEKNVFNSYLFLGLIGLCVFEFIMIIVSVVSKNKQLKKILRSKLDTKTEYEKSLESVDDETYKDEENITDDLTDEYMSTESNEISLENDNDSVDDSTDDDNLVDGDKISSDDDYGISNLNDDSLENSNNENTLGHTALISRDVTNVYNNTKNRKESIKERKLLRKRKKKIDDDDMFKF